MLLLGTHDVQDINITNRANLTLYVHYLYRSRANGVLFLLMHITPERNIDFTRSVFVIVKRNVTDVDALDFEIPRNEYIALGYDVESDGLVHQEEAFHPAWRANLIDAGSDQGTSV